MSYNPKNPDGQATMAESQPVVLASDQSTVSVNVTNLPATQPVSGSVSVSNLPATQEVSGNVTAETELPAAAALADAVANPTTPIVGAALMAFNGTTFDRVRTDGTDNDADPVSSTGVLSVEAHLQGFNGTNFDRIRTQDALSGNTANDSVVGVLAVSSGPGYSIRYNPTNLGTAANSASTINVEGANSVTFGISTTTTGTIIFEGTSDNTNWISVEVFDGTTDLWVSGQSITPTAGKVYQVLTQGYRQVRMRTVTTLGATVAHTITLSTAQQFLGGIDTGAAPHNFGYQLVHKDVEYTTAQTGTVIWTPTTGKKFAITDITITTGGTTAGLVTLFDAASATTTYAAGTTPAIFRGNFAPSATSYAGVVKSFNVPYVSTTANNVLHITTSAAMTVYVQINGYEI